MWLMKERGLECRPVMRRRAQVAAMQHTSPHDPTHTHCDSLKRERILNAQQLCLTSELQRSMVH